MRKPTVPILLTSLIAILAAAVWMSCIVAGNSQQQVAEQFIENLNQGKLRQAGQLTDSQFYVIYRHEYARKSGDDYLASFQSKIKFHPHIKILRSRASRDSVWIETANTSDYSRLLKFGPRMTQFIFGFAGNKISSMQIDTLPGHTRYLEKNDQCWLTYMRWLGNQDSLLLEDLKKDWYSAKAKKWLTRYAGSMQHSK